MSSLTATGPASKFSIASAFRFCTPAICRYDRSYYLYRIDLAPNVLFLVVFLLSLVGFLGVYIKTRRALSFTLAMCLGLACEVLGYAGRIMCWKNQWGEDGFLMQIICLTIGPAFLAAGIYFCLQRIVCIFGPENSRLKPELYPRIVSELFETDNSRRYVISGQLTVLCSSFPAMPFPWSSKRWAVPLPPLHCIPAMPSPLATTS